MRMYKAGRLSHWAAAVILPEKEEKMKQKVKMKIEQMIKTKRTQVKDFSHHAQLLVESSTALVQTVHLHSRPG